MPRAIAEGLRRRGHDVTTAANSDLIGASDQEHLDFAHRNHRVLVTRDVDFLRLNAQQAPHAGIVFWTQRRSIGQLISALDMLTLRYSPEELEQDVQFL
jgi:predicted nuclease of predicted toxin-antitoxin system